MSRDGGYRYHVLVLQPHHFFNFTYFYQLSLHCCTRAQINKHIVTNACCIAGRQHRDTLETPVSDIFCWFLPSTTTTRQELELTDVLGTVGAYRCWSLNSLPMCLWCSDEALSSISFQNHNH